MINHLRFKRKEGYLQRHSPEDSSHYCEKKRRRGTGRGRDGNVLGRGWKFLFGVYEPIQAAEGPCPKEGRFNIRLWRLCFTVWDTHSAPFRPINPHSAFNLRVFASYSPSHPYTALVEEGRSPWRRRASRRPIVGRLHRRRLYEHEKDDNNWWERKGVPPGGVRGWSAVSRDVAGIKSTIEKHRASPAAVTTRKFIAG